VHTFILINVTSFKSWHWLHQHPSALKHVWLAIVHVHYHQLLPPPPPPRLLRRANAVAPHSSGDPAALWIDADIFCSKNVDVVFYDRTNFGFTSAELVQCASYYYRPLIQNMEMIDSLEAKLSLDVKKRPLVLKSSENQRYLDDTSFESLHKATQKLMDCASF
jgi:hypothetical protein